MSRAMSVNTWRFFIFRGVSPLRYTSLKVYNEIKEEGLLAKKRMQVYEAVFKNTRLTANELYKTVNFKDLTQSNIHARLGELRSLGVVYEFKKRKCSITGRTAIVWDVTNNLPVKPVKSISSQKKIRILKKALEMSFEVLDNNKLTKHKREIIKYMRGAM